MCQRRTINNQLKILEKGSRTVDVLFITGGTTFNWPVDIDYRCIGDLRTFTRNNCQSNSFFAKDYLSSVIEIKGRQSTLFEQQSDVTDNHQPFDFLRFQRGAQLNCSSAEREKFRWNKCLTKLLNELPIGCCSMEKLNQYLLLVFVTSSSEFRETAHLCILSTTHDHWINQRFFVLSSEVQLKRERHHLQFNDVRWDEEQRE